MVSIEGHARTTLAHVREVTAQIRANLKADGASDSGLVWPR